MTREREATKCKTKQLPSSALLHSNRTILVTRVPDHTSGGVRRRCRAPCSTQSQPDKHPFANIAPPPPPPPSHGTNIPLMSQVNTRHYPIRAPNLGAALVWRQAPVLQILKHHTYTRHHPSRGKTHVPPLAQTRQFKLIPYPPTQTQPKLELPEVRWTRSTLPPPRHSNLNPTPRQHHNPFVVFWNLHKQPPPAASVITALAPPASRLCRLEFGG